MKPFTPAPVKPVVSADGLKAFDIRVGTISGVADVPSSDRLVRLTVDFGDHRRQIVAGIKSERADPTEIRGKQALFVLNLDHANLVVTAWDGARMVGISRSLTDFVYATYLSDLAVRKSYQRTGIGRELVRLTQEAAPRATLILLAAPAAEKYYPHIGFEHHPQAWILRGGIS